MKKALKYLGNLILFTLLTQLAMAQSSTDLTQDAKIKFEKRQNILQIKGTYENPATEKESLKYKLQTEKTGRSGRSNNTQSGSFVADPGQEVTLSQLAIAVSPDDTYKIRLSVFNKNDQLISQDSVLFEGN